MTDNKTGNITDKSKDMIRNSRLYQNIKRRNRQEWQELYKTNFSKFYNLLTDDGERALLAGVVCGVLAVFLFKEIIILLFLVLAASGLIWMIAEDAPPVIDVKPEPADTAKPD